MALTLPTLHPGQRTVWDERARFKVLASGRRWGKTLLGSLACVHAGGKGGRAWWVAPSYKMAQVGWRAVMRLGRQVPGAEVRQGDLMVRFPGGGSVQVRSADDPQSLRGEGLTLAVMDECAFMAEAAWAEALRPALSDRLGGALFISTPKGRNWFWRLWQRGQDDSEADWRSWQFPTATNPYIAPGEIDAARRDLPERIYQQEYEALFLDDAGGVFRKVMAAATLQPAPPSAGRQYVMGVDWGKSNDFTVLTVLDAGSGEMVCMDRFNRIDYAVQRGRLAALAEKYRPTVILAESNAMGEPIIETLQREGLPVRGFVTTNATKAQIIEGLALAFEQGAIRVLNDPVLVGELQGYEMDRSPSGMVRYSAPEGLHDDCVMSLALAWHARADGTWWIF
ncbi:MAG: Terminase-like family protein [Chloroflexi bacterium ADurb.Bin222]|nr:MAG: Terminase-like family protein [Chloroflexi bacterium ADurb.Bin222]